MGYGILRGSKQYAKQMVLKKIYIPIMPLEIVRNDITKIKADAIVNSASRKPVCGGGTEYQIYEAAGRENLLKVREQIGVLDVSEVAETPAFALDAKYIIHTLGPKWNDGKSGETIALASCYRNALEKAKELGRQSIAFPLISSGVFRFPKDYAVRIATQAIGEFLQKNEMLVTLVVFDRKAFEVSEELYCDIQAFIDDNYVQDKYEGVRRYAKYQRKNRNIPDEERYCKLNNLCDNILAKKVPIRLAKKECVVNTQVNLDEILATPGETFCDKLFNLIHEKKLNDVEVYKKANLDRKHFSKIRSNVNYKPTKKTALALAIALHLNKDETVDLLARAELAFSPSSKSDLIVSYFIWEINNMLFKFGLPTLGA